MQGHSAADGPSSAAAAVAATAAAMAPNHPSGAGSRFSFIAAATGASTAAGVLGVRQEAEAAAKPQVRHRVTLLVASC
jgi:hypothetical protein